MATGAAAKLLESLDEKITELREAVEGLTEATEKLSQTETEAPKESSRSAAVLTSRP